MQFSLQKTIRELPLACDLYQRGPKNSVKYSFEQDLSQFIFLFYLDIKCNIVKLYNTFSDMIMLRDGVRTTHIKILNVNNTSGTKVSATK